MLSTGVRYADRWIAGGVILQIGVRYADQGGYAADGGRAARKMRRGDPRKGRAFPHSGRRRRWNVQTGVAATPPMGVAFTAWKIHPGLASLPKRLL